MLEGETPVSSDWLAQERSWLLDYARKNPAGVPDFARQIGQKGFIFPLRLNLKRSPVFISLVLAASLLLSGGGVVAAAQNDLPNEPLYNIKIASEKVRAAVTADTKARAQLWTNFAKKRLEEIKTINKLISLKAEVRAAAIARAESNYRANLEAAESGVVQADSNNGASALRDASVASKIEGEMSAQEETLVRLETEVPIQAKKAIRRALIRARDTRETASAIKAGLKVEADAREEARSNASAAGTSKSYNESAAASAKAEGRVKAAENKFRASTEILKRAENKADASVETNAKLVLAGEALLRAKSALEAQEYRRAWLEASASIRLSIEAMDR